MNTSQYDAETRKDLKRFQRSPGYAIMKQAHLAARTKLEDQLRERDAVIDRLKRKLVESGIAADEVATLEAAAKRAA